MALLGWLLAPLLSLISLVIGPIVRALSGQDISKLPLVTEEELRLLVNVGEEEGLIEPDEREMIEGIFSFGDTVVREVMIPRVDIVALDETASLEEALELVIAHGHSRIPVYHDTIDQISGILYAKDLLPWLRAGQRDKSFADLLRPPHFVPETMKVDALLKDLQARKVHLAIVVDEYGGTAGLATIEDLLEEIVGEIQDEYDAEEPSVRFVRRGRADCRCTRAAGRFERRDRPAYSDPRSPIGSAGWCTSGLGACRRLAIRCRLTTHATITVLSVEGLRPRQLRLTYQPAGEVEVSASKGGVCGR